MFCKNFLSWRWFRFESKYKVNFCRVSVKIFYLHYWSIRDTLYFIFAEIVSWKRLSSLMIPKLPHSVTLIIERLNFIAKIVKIAFRETPKPHNRNLRNTTIGNTLVMLNNLTCFKRFCINRWLRPVRKKRIVKLSCS